MRTLLEYYMNDDLRRIVMKWKCVCAFRQMQFALKLVNNNNQSDVINPLRNTSVNTTKIAALYREITEYTKS